MNDTIFVLLASLRMTDVCVALQAAEAKATEIGVPMSMNGMDMHGVVRGFIKMDGPFVHAQDTSFSKAYSAVSLPQPTGWLPPSVPHEIGSITKRRLTNLNGRIPVPVRGIIVGGVGVGRRMKSAPRRW